MNICLACDKPARRKFCSTRCGNRWRYQNDPRARDVALKSAARYRDVNRVEINQYFKQRRSTTVRYYEELIYWATTKGDEDDRIELAHTIMDAGLGNYSTAIVEDFIIGVLEDE